MKKPMPWRRSANEKRAHESVRPIFWANRPKSYLARTIQWKDFPHARWGDFQRPAFGEINDFPRDLTQLYPTKCKETWGKPLANFEDIKKLFVNFCEGKIARTPWFDEPLALESARIKDHLINLNNHGLLTINSQPRMNAVSSDEKVVTWGESGGYIYQKAYVEFFISEQKMDFFLKMFKHYPSLTFHAINKEGISYSNTQDVNAVTWGIFKGKEILQPTVVDPQSFMIWKEEAFDIWLSIWGSLYEKESLSYHLLEDISNSFYLVNIVDNDFIAGNIWTFFDDYFKIVK